MVKNSKRLLLWFVGCLLLAISCGPPPAENIYRKEGRFPGGLNVPVSLIVIEWGGKPRVMGSGWLIDGSRGVQFSAKHVTGALMNSIIELGTSECKIFLGSRVYTCFVDRVPPLRDAVLLKTLEPIDTTELLAPYKIATTKLKVGDKVFVQGFHPHPSEITKSNMADGLRDMIVPILRTFYGLREADPLRQREIVFDSLEATVVKLDEHIKIGGQEPDPSDEIKFKTNEYIEVVTSRNHKFSFAGLSGGVAVRVNEQGVVEAVGIVTAEMPERLEYDKRGYLKKDSVPVVVSDTIMITPIYSVKDLYDYARQVR